MVWRQGRNLVGGAMIGALSISAQAQSKVTLYGLIDEGFMYQSNVGGATGGKKFSLDSASGIQGSRWGMSGAEDLGGGLSTIFTLESGVNINNGAFGQGGTAFGRQAFVGISSLRYGSLTLGRQYDMILYFGQPYTSAGMVGSVLFDHPGDLDNTGNTIRANNAIRYMSPNFNGLTFGGEYSVGGVAGNITASSGYSLGTSYVRGPLSVGGAFSYFKNPTSATAGGGFFTDNASGATTLANSLNKGYASANAYQVAVVGIKYTIGSVQLATSYSNTQYGNLGPSFLGGTARFNNVDFSVQYAYSPSLFLSAGYDYLIGKGIATADGKTVGNQHYNQLSVMADYYLSKRTDVYTGAAWQRASGTSSTGAPAVADITNLGDSTNNHQIVVRVAIRHRF